MTRRTRIIVGIILLAISVSMLVWSLAPMRREIRTQPIAPADLQLPTPASLHSQPVPFA